MVLGAAVKLLSNPIVWRMALTLLAAGFAFVMGLGLMRRLRRSISDEAVLIDDRPSGEGLGLQTYHAVIQQLKQQKHELLSLQQAERRKAKARETISAGVLSHLPCGVVFFTTQGLVRQANQAAKQILGLGALAGMSPGEIFRDATLTSPSDLSYGTLAEAVDAILREKVPSQQMVAQYKTPAGQERNLEITMSSLHAPEGEVLGAACLINDKTEMEGFRRRQELHGEMSAEMALELRTSLATISGYAQQLAATRDPGLARQLASDIAAEAARLDRTIGGFLAGANRAHAAAEV